MYEFCKQFFYSTYECAYAAQAMYISNMKDLVVKYKYAYEDMV